MEEEFEKKRRGDGKVYWKQTSFVRVDRRIRMKEGRKEMVVERTRKKILTKKQKKEIS